jgi:hypothetical protein
MPRGTEVQVGFFWPQSKQTWSAVSTLGVVCVCVRAWPGNAGACLVCRLRLELVKDLERLLLGREATHVGGCGMRTVGENRRSGWSGCRVADREFVSRTRSRTRPFQEKEPHFGCPGIPSWHQSAPLSLIRSSLFAPRRTQGDPTREIAGRHQQSSVQPGSSAQLQSLS